MLKYPKRKKMIILWIDVEFKLTSTLIHPNTHVLRWIHGHQIRP